MITINLVDTILKYQNGENEIIIELLNKFELKIKKLSKKLKYECAEIDLKIYFIELIKSINISNFKNKCDNCIFKYLNICLDNKSNMLYKSNSKFNNEIIGYDDEINTEKEYLQTNKVEIYAMLDCLNDIQKKIIISKYINKLTDNEIASALGISRQSVYSNKNKALDKLKKYYF